MDANVALRRTAVLVQTIYQKDDILADTRQDNRRREISPFWLACLLEDVQIEVDGGNIVQQRVSLKWLNQTSDSLTYTSGDICNGNSPKCILTRVLDISFDGSDIILTTEEVTGSVELLMGTMVRMMTMRMKVHHQLQRMRAKYPSR